MKYFHIKALAVVRLGYHGGLATMRAAKTISFSCRDRPAESGLHLSPGGTHHTAIRYRQTRCRSYTHRIGHLFMLLVHLFIQPPRSPYCTASLHINSDVPTLYCRRLDRGRLALGQRKTGLFSPLRRQQLRILDPINLPTPPQIRNLLGLFQFCSCWLHLHR